MSNRPIGIFDSGLGGASVLREALKRLPHEDYVYFGDNRNAPYGDRTEAEISRLTLDAANRLAARGVKTIVIACNTATGTCIEEIRARFSMPVISMEPAIKPACERPGQGKVFMMATLATTRLTRYRELQSRMPDPERVLNIPCPGLVERIEQGIYDDDAFDDLLFGYLGPYHGLTIDGIVLGCTHYIFIANAIQKYAKRHFSGECALFDGNEATVRQLERVLLAHGLVNGHGDANVEFLTSSSDPDVKKRFDALMNL